MSIRTVTAMFATRAEAQKASEALMSQLHIDHASLSTSPEAGMADAGYDASRPYEETGFFGALKSLFVSDDDRYAYAEGLRRGRILVTAKVEDGHVDQAIALLEQHGALDLDAEEASWRNTGWTGYSATAYASTRSTAPVMTQGTMPRADQTIATTALGTDDTIKVVEERLAVGKREVNRGGVRVRSYVVETPVEERVTLRDETVRVERHPVDRVATAADLAGFQERVIEATETDEEAVVSKTARVVEEIGLKKDATERVEVVKDTVRKTQVDVEQLAGTATRSATGTNPPGTMASRAVDDTLGTNLSNDPKKV